MPYPSLLIADYLLANRTQPFTPVHILKLTYICHGWTLALNDVPLIREKVEAWKYGPVIRTLYSAFRKYGASPITHLSSYDTSISDTNAVEAWKGSTGRELDGERDVLDGVLDEYGGFTAVDLIRITHRRDSPWGQCYDKSRRDTVIPDYVTKEYYRGIADGRIE